MLAERNLEMMTRKLKLYDVLAHVAVIGTPILLGTALGWIAHRMKGNRNG